MPCPQEVAVGSPHGGFTAWFITGEDREPQVVDLVWN